MAYGYTDEYILDKTPEWLETAIEHIGDDKMDSLEMNAAIHGAEVKGNRRQRRREKKAQKGKLQDHPRDATPEELRNVGIFNG